MELQMGGTLLVKDFSVRGNMKNETLKWMNVVG
jgi:hypothetical protein